MGAGHVTIFHSNIEHLAPQLIFFLLTPTSVVGFPYKHYKMNSELSSHLHSPLACIQTALMMADFPL